MTEKKLSEKICEACGIEPEIIEDYDSNEYEIYPDFENKNFVKLFNLKYTEDEDDTIANFVFLRYRNIINTRSFLGCFLFELQHGNYKEVEQIKQAIREEKWDV